jgi:hypothetical protein
MFRILPPGVKLDHILGALHGELGRPLLQTTLDTLKGVSLPN